MSSSPLPSPGELPVLVSACLLGETCRFDGGHEERPSLTAELSRRGERAIAFCPEVEGGLGVPRPPAWIEASGAAAVLDGRDRVVTEDGADVTQAFLRGGRRALDACRRHGIARAYLKERSPSCGVRRTHVASRLAEGPGLTAEILRRAGIDVRGL